MDDFSHCCAGSPAWPINQMLIPAMAAPLITFQCLGDGVRHPWWQEGLAERTVKLMDRLPLPLFLPSAPSCLPVSPLS